MNQSIPCSRLIRTVTAVNKVLVERRCYKNSSRSMALLHSGRLHPLVIIIILLTYLNGPFWESGAVDETFSCKDEDNIRPNPLMLIDKKIKLIKSKKNKSNRVVVSINHSKNRGMLETAVLPS